MSRKCATMQNFFAKLDDYPEYRAKRQQLQALTAQAGLRSASDVRRFPRKIPVVVHIVYKDKIDNLSDEQISSQFRVLNEDFSTKNVDIRSVPDPFKPFIGNAGLSFYLAKTDPSGKKTKGITRTKTSKDCFDVETSEVHFARSGGVDAWDTERYLNIWVCRIKGNYAGYANFPGGPPETDGVVVYSTNFGVKGSAEAPLDLGRTCTHEIGHYLNLEHIWGYCQNGVCEDSDQVSDTPNQYGPNSNDKDGKPPSFPSCSCANGPHGDMFMNYMDYVDDNTMVMFSKGQVERMHSALEFSRSRLGT